MSPIALLDPRSHPTSPYAALIERGEIDAIDVYALPSTDLTGYRALVIGGTVDQEFLFAHRHIVADLLGRRGVVLFCGHLLRAWLPGCGRFVPREVHSFHDYAVHLVEPHPIFDGVTERDLTFRRGVAGFFARGHHPPPDGATVLAALPGGEPITYIDRRTTPGTVLAHAGNDLLTTFDGVDSTASRVAPAVLAWLRRETSC